MARALRVLPALCAPAAGGRLAVQNGALTFDGGPVFLSGANQPWLDYGSDFGNNRPTEDNYCKLKNDYLVPLRRAGGHVMRFWLFVEGAGGIPAWNADGTVNATDAAGSLAADMRRYVRLAASMDVLVVWCLWNGAVLRDERTIAMITEPSGAKLQSFIDNALTPLVAALKGEDGIGAWEIMNEPEGSLAANVADSEPCYDTTPLANSGAGWAQPDSPIAVKWFQRFVAWQSKAIHQADAGALVTLGAWNPKANTDADGFRNYWSDACLEKAGGSGSAAQHLDFYQIHSYPSGGGFDSEAPFAGLDKAHYQLDKPVVIGEFPAAATNGGATDTQLYQYAYAAGYDGAWGWALNGGNGTKNLSPGMDAIRSKPRVGIAVGGAAPADSCAAPPAPAPIPAQPVPPCTDIAPDTQYTCADQAGWGKCSDDFMKGYCCRTCFGCEGILQCGGAGPPPPTPPPGPPTPAPQTCADVAPDTQYTCAQQKSWGKCDTTANPWMAGYCCRTCFACDAACGH